MKKTFLIDDIQFWALMRNLIDRFGYPRFDEELVIYFSTSDHFKVSITSQRMIVSWSDGAANDPYNRATHRVTMDVGNLKEKLLFFSNHYGRSGVISVSRSYAFRHSEGRVAIDVKPTTLVGHIISFSYYDTPDANQNLDEMLEMLRDFLRPGLIEEIGNVTTTPEAFLYGQPPRLNSTVLDFCKRNGINALAKETTYRKLLSAKSNDYTPYDDVFTKMMGVSLLDPDRSVEVQPQTSRRASLIVPCYNTENTILFLLESIRAQRLPEKTFREMEVILIDDCSKRPLFETVDPTAFPFQVRILRLSENGGVSHARQLGVAHASGEILIFLDSDLVLTPRYVADHLVRNAVVENAVFVSFKENVERDDERISLEQIQAGVPQADYSRDLRVHKDVTPETIGSYKVTTNESFEILEETNYFKDFHGSRVFGVYDHCCPKQMKPGERVPQDQGVTRKKRVG